MSSAAEHPFVRRPHRTMVALSFPVLISLIPEPLTGLADTAFVKSLGAVPAAALGVGTMVLSGALWIFNFLAISTQTEVARCHSSGEEKRARELTALALLLGAGFGALLCGVGWFRIDEIASWMGASDRVLDDATAYLGIRLFGAPAVLITVVAFGALRGVQDMHTPMWIALAINVLNIALDALLIFGLGPIPALGIAGAAWATVISQVLGAAWALWALRARLGLRASLHLADAKQLLVVGWVLFARTGLLLFFLLYGTRAATRCGTDAGAAHQAIRTVWLFTALVLDAFATTAQSLVSHFVGARRIDLARRCAGVAAVWALATGLTLALAMAATTSLVSDLLVPAGGAVTLFASAWLVCALAQPVNALCFVTDGIHWGTGDYRYLRNAMLAATAFGVLAIELLDLDAPNTLDHIWWITAGWITIRATLGMMRVWPGLGAAPLRERTEAERTEAASDSPRSRK